MSRKTYLIEVTDTFGGEANFSWVRRYRVYANSTRGAMQVLAHHRGSGWRKDFGDDEFARYNSLGVNVCAFVELANEDISFDNCETLN